MVSSVTMSICKARKWEIFHVNNNNILQYLGISCNIPDRVSHSVIVFNSLKHHGL